MKTTFAAKSMYAFIFTSINFSVQAAPASDLPSFRDTNPAADALVDAAFKAVVSDFKTLKRLIEVEHVDPNAKKDGLTLLGALFNSLNSVYWHPLENWKAIEGTTSFLLAMGADPNLHFSYGSGDLDYTLLQFAAYDGNLDMVKLLSYAGADANGTDSDGRTALHAAAKCDFRLSNDQRAAATIEFLLSRGAEMTTQDALGMSPLDLVPTPCGREPALCEMSTIASVSWPTGTCKETYRVLKAASEAAL